MKKADWMNGWILTIVIVLHPFVGQSLTQAGQDVVLEASPDPVFDLTDEATVEAWIKLPEKNFRNSRVVSKSQSFGNAGYFLGFGGNGNQPELTWGTSRGELRVNTKETKIPVNEWIHIAGVFSANKGFNKLYLNGKEVASQTSNPMPALTFSPMPLTVGGAALEPERTFGGEIGRVGIYNEALSAEEIFGLAKSADKPGLTTPSRVAEWRLPLKGTSSDASSRPLRAISEPGARASGPDSLLTLWYPRPAREWVEALPVGNGRFGAMVFGRPDWERLQLNDITVWSGGPEPKADRPEAWKSLPEIRRLIRDGHFAEAEKLVNQTFTSGSGYNASYQTLGDLSLNVELPGGAVTNYLRWLDLETAVAGVEFEAGGAKFSREVFSSAPDQVLVTRLTTSQKGALNFSVTLSRVQNAVTQAEGNDTLVMIGNTGPTLHYEVQTRVLAPGGLVKVEGNRIVVRGATEATILTAAGTNYVLDYARGYRGEDPHEAVASRIAAASGKSFADLRAAHIADHQNYFNRLTLDLGVTDAARHPTDERMRVFKDGRNDPALAMLYYQFGRYLLISSSRPDNPLPSNSQGIWGDGLDLPWKCDYKSNINYEMNYWPALAFNLAECNLPMIRHVSSLVEPGRKTAQAYYDAPGWNIQMMTNAWGWTSPGRTLSWGVWTGASGWLLQNFWEHYAFTRDKEFLKSVYPVMKEACEFYLAILIPDENGKLIVSPSTSPENGFITPDGQKSSVIEGTTAEMAIIWDVFNNTAQAAKELGIDPEFQKTLTDTRDRIRPLRIGQHGQLMEWSGDWDREDDKHRHISHLFPLHPGRQINVLAQPELAAACRRTLEMRGDEGTGWSKAWKVNFWARLRDGDHSYKLLCDLLRLVGNAGMNMTGGGTYANLFDAHPPFQIDGNFGAPSGMNEMLLQSHESYTDPAAPNEERFVLDLLPALPGAWPNGSIKGLRARGGFEVDLAWRDGKLSAVTIRSVNGTGGKVRYGQKTASLFLQPGRTVSFDGSLNATR